MTPPTEFERTQHTLDILFSQYDVLLGDYSRHEAATILAARHQIDRFKLVALINDRDAGLIGQSGETTYGVISTAYAEAGTT